MRTHTKYRYMIELSLIKISRIRKSLFKLLNVVFCFLFSENQTIWVNVVQAVQRKDFSIDRHRKWNVVKTPFKCVIMILMSFSFFCFFSCSCTEMNDDVEWFLVAWLRHLMTRRICRLLVWVFVWIWWLNKFFFRWHWMIN